MTLTTEEQNHNNEVGKSINREIILQHYNHKISEYDQNDTVKIYWCWICQKFFSTLQYKPTVNPKRLK